MTAMESDAYPEYCDVEERREGIVVFIDRITPQGRTCVRPPSTQFRD